MAFWAARGGRKDCFPGADGSTITQTGSPNAETIAIYGADGNVLTEGSETGLQFVNITTNGVLNGNTSQVYVIKHPLSFVYNQNEPWDWYTDNETYQNDALWGEGVDKSDFDPCPTGWCVPTDRTWSDFSKTTMPASGSDYTAHAGRMYNKIAWYPAAGYRNYRLGTLIKIGFNGVYWSAIAESSNANYFVFNLTGVSIDTFYRSRAFPIRCVQE